MTTTAARNATLADLVPLLRDRQARKIDVVVPARTLRADKGDLIVRGGGVELSEDGVTTVDGRYTPTSSCDGDIAARLDIPIKYLRRMRNDRPWIYDTIVNDALRGRTRGRSCSAASAATPRKVETGRPGSPAPCCRTPTG